MADDPEIFSFLQSEFETSAEYLSHVEDKLLNVLIFYSTLLFGVVSACSYIAAADLFAKLYWLRPVLIGVASGLFSAIGILLLGVYTDLRVMKVRTLEQMASVRSHFVVHAKSLGMGIGRAVGKPSAVSACPKFLERPSDDWYTVVLMAFVNGLAVSVCVDSVLFGILTVWFNVHGAELWALMALFGGVSLVIPAYTQFRWITRWCFILDCRREVSHVPSTASPIMPDESSAIPFVVRGIAQLAGWIEKTHRPAIMKGLGAERGSHALEETEGLA